MIGKTISHYKIIEKLGQGGMGEVYLAEDLNLERRVALKFLPQHLTNDKDTIERFKREAKAAAALNHPNIITIYEIIETDKQICIVMEYVDGQTLRDIINPYSKFPVPNFQYIIQQLAAGLSSAHNAGIVHRDIKPENILINDQGQVKILDFGLAKLKGVSKLTKETSTLGTIYYMSPEQIQGREVDQRADIWSLGVVLYEMLSGQRPFSGDYEQAVTYAILNEEPDYQSEHIDSIRYSWSAILKKTLAKKADDRYSSVAALLDDLQKINDETEKRGQNQSDKPSLAVLPFVNMSADAENEYFSDGLTEELINALTTLKDFRVVARTSAFAFKGKQTDIRDIGRQLNVQQVLEGSVRKAGSRIRITAQLITVEDGYHLWSEKYDRDLEDVFALQDEIASEIARKLKSEFITRPSLLDTEKQPDLEAYELYLKGRYHFNKFSSGWANKALECFQGAISLTPDFAPAYAALARTYIFLTNPFGTLDNQIAMPKAKSTAERALEIDANLSEAYVSMGSIATFHEWDSAKAHHFFKKAIALNANDVNARLWYELALSLLDQDFDEALAQVKVALELDPLNLLILVRIGYVYVYKYDFDTALTYYNKIIQIEPALAAGYHGLQDIYGLQGKYDLAIEAGEKAVKLGHNEPPYQTCQ
jgi:serine/threonine protein kinase/Tfp pilus assembly protein PilF